MADFDPDAYLESKPTEFNPDSYLKGTEGASDNSFSPMRTLKQVPLGVARGLQSMARLGEGQLETENLTDRPAPKVDDYAPGMDKIIGGENKPRNIYEKMASGAGEALPFAVGTGAIGPANLAVQGVAGAAGAGAEHLFPELGHWGNALGSMVGALGAGRVANAVHSYMNPRAANEFGIPLTTGQRTAEPAQVALEEDIRKGGKGSLSQAVMTNFDKRQRGAVGKAIDDTGAGLGGQPTTLEEAGSTIGGSLEREASGRHQASTAFYDRAAEKGAWIHDTHDLARRTRVGLHEAKFGELDKVNHPGAMRAMRHIEDMGDETGVASIQKMEQTRKALQKFNSNPQTEDGLALSIIKRAYDGWESDVVTNRLLTGDKSALDDLRRARELWKEYKDLTGRKQGPERVIAEIVNGEHSPEKIANYVVGSSSVGGSSASSAVIRKIKEIFPEGTTEFDALRQAAFNKLTVNPIKDGMTPMQTATSIRKFINGNGAPVARELFSQEERSKLMRLADTLEKTTPKQSNPSGSGSAVARLVLPSMGSLGGAALGWYTGDPKFYALMALPWVRDVNAVRKALSAIRDTPNPIGYGQSMIPIGPREGTKNAENP